MNILYSMCQKRFQILETLKHKLYHLDSFGFICNISFLNINTDRSSESSFDN